MNTTSGSQPPFKQRLPPSGDRTR